MFSVFQAITSRWALLGTIDYTLWRTFNYVTAYHVAQGTAFSSSTISTPEKFRNSWHLALAANFIATEKWLLRLGLAYDQRPTVNETRTVEFPNGNLVAAGIGGRYKFNSKVAVDLGYLHSFIRPTSINHTSAATGASEIGKLQTTGDVFGLGMVWNLS
jgi:long-chain fatty acid transport protein